MASHFYQFYCPHCKHRLTYRQHLYREGDRRLRDLSYATLLKQAGYYVPGRYLPPAALDIDPEPIRVKPVRIVQSKLKKVDF